ncbi:MAG: NADH-quinone oxidoreductase subunit C, partial [Actinomycetales bacterium]|nr:NADH-quinone oxidoreductase subunit C [Actinomycetales bacterium]
MNGEIRVLAPDELVGESRDLLGRGYRLALVAGLDDERGLHVVYSFLAPGERTIELRVALDGSTRRAVSLAALSFPASRFERELFDLYGIEPVGHPQRRPLVRHAHWPEGYHPMAAGAGPVPVLHPDEGGYPFIEVEGPGVYEIPVGPVHAGLIEPGHFRFSVVGETILKMKARLWFTHKGIERLVEGKTIEQATQVAERVSGDSAVGHGLAFARAVEDALGIAVAPEVEARRAVALELERLYNHVADLGALANDVGFGLANAKALTLRE